MSGIKEVLSTAKRSKIAKEAEHGHKFAKKKKNSFKNVEKKAESEGHSKESAEKIAGSVFWKARAKK